MAVTLRYFTDALAFKVNGVKAVYCLRQKCSPKNPVFWQRVTYDDIRRVTENKYVRGASCKVVM